MKPNAMLKSTLSALCALALLTGCATHADKSGEGTADTICIPLSQAYGFWVQRVTLSRSVF